MSKQVEVAERHLLACAEAYALGYSVHMRMLLGSHKGTVSAEEFKRSETVFWETKARLEAAKTALISALDEEMDGA